MGLRWLAVAGILLTGVPFAAQERPLPPLDTFLANARPKLRSDRALLSQYTYLEREREIRLSKLGKVELGKEKLYQVYPGLSEADRYRRLIAIDGVDRDSKELARDDQKHQKDVLEATEKRARESADDREKRLRRDAEARRQESDTIDDVFRIYEFRPIERQSLDGHPTIVLDFAPRPGVAPKTDFGKMMKKVKGRAWITEDDFEMARVEIEMIEDLPIALSLGKLYKGTTGSFTRRKVNNEIWLPAEVRFNGMGRALVRKFRVDSVVQYSDYRKFSVETGTAFKATQ